MYGDDGYSVLQNRTAWFWGGVTRRWASGDLVRTWRRGDKATLFSSIPSNFIGYLCHFAPQSPPWFFISFLLWEFFFESRVLDSLLLWRIFISCDSKMLVLCGLSIFLCNWKRSRIKLQPEVQFFCLFSVVIIPGNKPATMEVWPTLLYIPYLYCVDRYGLLSFRL